MMRASTVVAALVSALVLTTGCSAEAPAGDLPGRADPAATGVPVTRGTSGTASQSVPAAPSEGQVSCEDGVVMITETNASLRFVTDCALVTVAGGHLELKAKNVESLVISGSDVVVSATSITTVTVTGANNKVTWSEGRPRVSDTGRANKIG